MRKEKQRKSSSHNKTKKLKEREKTKQYTQRNKQEQVGNYKCTSEFEIIYSGE